MSGEACRWADDLRDLTVWQRAVLDCLAAHAEKGTHRSWPAVPTIAEEKGIGERTVERALGKLLERKLIGVERPGGGSGITTIYVLAVNENPVSVTGLFDDETPPATTENPATKDRKPRHERQKTPPRTTGEPIGTIHEPERQPRNTRGELLATNSKTPAKPAKRPAVAASVEPPGFRDFWTAYPHKQKRGEAVKSFTRALKRDGAAVIAAGLTRWVAYWQSEATEQRFIPHPTTWLNQARYLDQPPAPARSPDPTEDAVRQRMRERGEL
jgi:hypothetical protein